MSLEWEKLGTHCWVGREKWLTYTLNGSPKKQSWDIVYGGVASSNVIGIASTLEWAKTMAQEDADDRLGRIARTER